MTPPSFDSYNLIYNNYIIEKLLCQEKEIRMLRRNKSNQTAAGAVFQHFGTLTFAASRSSILSLSVTEANPINSYP
jgi:hypothetical protein